MAKRFTDSDKWKKWWFRALSPVHKCFWIYICDNCNHAGMWEVDFDLAEVFIGTKLDPDTIKQTFDKQYIEVGGGKRWFIRDFVVFQYGVLKEDSRTHQSVIDILKKERVYKEYVKGKVRVRQGLKYRIKYRLKDRIKDKVNHLDYVFLTDKELTHLKDKFGDKNTKEWIARLNDYIGSKGVKYKSHYHTILNWERKQPTPKPRETKIQNIIGEPVTTKTREEINKLTGGIG